MTTAGKYLFGYAAAALCGAVLTASPAVAAEPAVPDDLVDAPFAEAIDLAAVRENLVSLNAGALIEQAVALEAAEQQVGRAHKSIRPLALLTVAARLAKETGDQQAIARLAEVAQARDDEQLTALVDEAQTRTRALVRIDPDLGIPLEELSPESVILFRSYRKQIVLAQAMGDIGTLAQLARGIELLTELHAAQREFLLKLIDEVRLAIGDRPETGDAGLSRLVASARQ